MKVFAFVSLALIAVTLGCTSSPKAPPAAPVPEAPTRSAASLDITLFSDKYGDAKVFFCDANSAVVAIDPNKCGETMAKHPGAGCTELAMYISTRLKAVKEENKTNLYNATGELVHTISKVKADSFLLKGARVGNKPVKIALKQLGANDLEEAKYYCH